MFIQTLKKILFEGIKAYKRGNRGLFFSQGGRERERDLNCQGICADPNSEKAFSLVLLMILTIDYFYYARNQRGCHASR